LYQEPPTFEMHRKPCKFGLSSAAPEALGEAISDRARLTPYPEEIVSPGPTSQGIEPFGAFVAMKTGRKCQMTIRSRVEILLDWLFGPVIEPTTLERLRAVEQAPIEQCPFQFPTETASGSHRLNSGQISFQCQRPKGHSGPHKWNKDGYTGMTPHTIVFDDPAVGK
jgi:hypothetical protein